MKKFIFLTIAVVIGLAIFILSKDVVEAPVSTPTPTPFLNLEGSSAPMSTISKSIITYSDSGYSLPSVTIKKGDSVVFKNSSFKMMWTASAVHPTHKAYPGSGIEKCGVNTLVAIFDACKGYGPGESWEFQFTEKGTWKYHNHLQPNYFGTVVVE